MGAFNPVKNSEIENQWYYQLIILWVIRTKELKIKTHEGQRALILFCFNEYHHFFFENWIIDVFLDGVNFLTVQISGTRTYNDWQKLLNNTWRGYFFFVFIYLFSSERVCEYRDDVIGVCPQIEPRTDKTHFFLFNWLHKIYHEQIWLY